MATYVFRYQLSQAPQPRTDGSGCIDHDVWAVYRLASDVDPAPWIVVPGRHQTISIPASEMKTVNDMPHSNGTQKTAKNTAFKQTLANNLQTTPVQVTGWSAPVLQTLLNGNDAATLEQGRIDTYIRTTLGLTYPVTFSM
jgi:hypothetical protein